MLHFDYAFNYLVSYSFNILFIIIKIVEIYTIEFQKRGLPPTHILLFLVKEHKFPATADTDSVISVESPDHIVDEEYYNVVSKFMMHGHVVVLG